MWSSVKSIVRTLGWATAVLIKVAIYSGWLLSPHLTAHRSVPARLVGQNHCCRVPISKSLRLATCCYNL